LLLVSLRGPLSIQIDLLLLRKKNGTSSLFLWTAWLRTRSMIRMFRCRQFGSWPTKTRSLTVNLNYPHSDGKPLAEALGSLDE